MGWKATGQPTVRKQRDKWVVRVDGIDTETGMHRPRQLGTYASQRSALTAEADQGGRSCCPAPMPSGWLAVPGGRAVGQTPVILAGFDGGHEDGRLGWCRNVKNPTGGAAEERDWRQPRDAPLP